MTKTEYKDKKRKEIVRWWVRVDGEGKQEKETFLFTQYGGRKMSKKMNSTKKYGMVEWMSQQNPFLQASWKMISLMTLEWFEKTNDLLVDFQCLIEE